ncbi:MAG: nucleotidyltransferase family protein [Methyloligellaceae bacterium]
MSALDRAMVLSAGYGKRMQPLTDKVPKPLVRLGGRPLLDHVLDRLGAAGVTTAVVNVHYLADQIENHLAGRNGPDIVVSDERDQLLDTGGGVCRALDLLGAAPFFIHNSDSVWIEGATSSLESLARAWDADTMDSLLMLAPVVNAVGYAGAGDFTMGPDGRLRRRTQGDIVPFVFAGVSIAHPRLFAECPEGPFSLNLLWDRALASGRLFGMRHEGIWMHIGTPEALEEAERCLEGEGV